MNNTLLTAAGAVALAAPALAGPQGIDVRVNGESLRMSAAAVRERQGQVLIPLRAVIESAGGHVRWMPATDTAIATLGDQRVRVPVGGSMASWSGGDTGRGPLAVVQNGHTLVPLRFLRSAFGASVVYNAGARTAWIDFDGQGTRSAGYRDDYGDRMAMAERRYRGAYGPENAWQSGGRFGVGGYYGPNYGYGPSYGYGPDYGYPSPSYGYPNPNHDYGRYRGYGVPRIGPAGSQGWWNDAPGYATGSPPMSVYDQDTWDRGNWNPESGDGPGYTMPDRRYRSGAFDQGYEPGIGGDADWREYRSHYEEPAYRRYLRDRDYQHFKKDRNAWYRDYDMFMGGQFPAYRNFARDNYSIGYDRYLRDRDYQRFLNDEDAWRKDYEAFRKDPNGQPSPSRSDLEKYRNQRDEMMAGMDWSWRNDDPRHFGPDAEDFAAPAGQDGSPR